MHGVMLLKRNNNHQNDYNYVPSLAGAAVACVIFALLAIALLFLTRRHRLRYTTILIIGATCEAIGYLFRSLSASGNRLYSFPLFLLMDMFIILSPLAFMAGQYVVFGRLIRRMRVIDADSPIALSSSSSKNEPALITTDSMSKPSSSDRSRAFSPVPAHLYTKIFVTCDIISFLIQAGGAGLIVSSKPSTARLGKYILLVGLAFGLASFSSFVSLVVWFLHSTYSISRKQGKQVKAIGLTTGWRSIMVPLLVASVCILVRTIYRMIEFAGGYSGHIYTTEWYLYVFDTTFMVICVAIWLPFWPGRFGLSQSLTGADELARKEEESSLGSSGTQEQHELGVVNTQFVVTPPKARATEMRLSS